MQDLFSAGALGCVYALVAFVSFLFAIMSLIGTEFGDVLDFDVDADADTGFDFANVSPFALAVFGATFGLVGLITLIWFEMEAIPSILISTVSGIVVGGLAQLLFLYVLSPSKSSHFSLEKDAVGIEAQVTITVPAEGQGQITFNNVSGRVQLGARSATGEEISNGEIVIIERIVGRAALVRPVDVES
jgi:membrane protein implicated in regulation of membrane protease activity